MYITTHAAHNVYTCRSSGSTGGGLSFGSLAQQQPTGLGGGGAGLGSGASGTSSGSM